MAERVGCFNGDKVPFFMETYNEEMDVRDIDDALRLEFFCRITAPRIYAEVKEHGEVGRFWRGALAGIRRTTKNPEPARPRPWVASAKTHRGETKVFQEFEWRFARLPEREQRLVGADKVLLFIRSIDRAEREAIGIELEEDDGANGFTEDWAKVGRVC